jgi:hypothetical protein
VKMWLDIACVIVGAFNLGLYAWAPIHDPANLAVGIFCLFAATWNPRVD